MFAPPLPHSATATRVAASSSTLPPVDCARPRTRSAAIASRFPSVSWLGEKRRGNPERHCWTGLLRFARNDGFALRHREERQRRSDPETALQPGLLRLRLAMTRSLFRQLAADAPAAQDRVHLVGDE